MNTIHRIAFGMLVLQLYTTAAPSDVSKIENTSEIDDVNITLDSEPHEITEEKKTNDNLKQSVRQKRFYNYYGYGFPPISPLIYPSNTKRDQSSETAIHGANDPFVQIHRRLQEIANIAKPASPPPPSHIPIFFPVIFIPQIGCNCNPNTNINTPQQPANNQNNTNPIIEERFPDLNDNRQNWGFVINETDTEYDEEEFIRPISFDPISVNRPLSRPPPPVEHGSSQGNEQSGSIQSTTTRRPATLLEIAPEVSYNELAVVVRPTNCDTAIISCCHQPQITLACFSERGCSELTSTGNPCTINEILRVVDKFQNFYGQVNG